MASLWSPKSSPDSTSRALDVPDVADTGLTTDFGAQTPKQLTSVPMGRPLLQRNVSQPPPPHQPPPPPSSQQVGNPNDSLSLMQLKRIITDFPRVDPTSYAFTYADAASLEEEINEWFSYNEAEFKRLNGARNTFERRWKKFAGKSWLVADRELREKFIKREIEGLQAPELQRRCKCLQTILHVILGIWDETAGTKPSEEEEPEVPKKKWTATKLQLEYMESSILFVAEAGGIPVLYEVMQNSFNTICDVDFRDSKFLPDDAPFIQDELDNSTTIMYIIMEGVRSNSVALKSAQKKLLELNPSLIDYLAPLTARLRWDEAQELPQTRIFLLFWKSILLVFGGTAELDEVKNATGEFPDSTGDSRKLITASPLDYHIFRQEITSKYPAYIPPTPLLPLEPDNNSILPPLPNRPRRTSGANGIILPPMHVNSSGASILHQPVHIATPAPSPPPSPPVGGKAGKKQNYQTNQNFPFMYPPLDSTSNSAGGKGAAGLQELLVGRKWEGSDIPKSILEAGELFAKRMRMTRAMRQLWDERERFLKFERGWEDKDENDIDIDELDLDSILAKKLTLDESKIPALEVDYGLKKDIDSRVKDKLDFVERFYRDSMPHLQSIVIVLLKAVLANVTALITQPNSSQSQGLAPAFRSEVSLRANGVQAQNRPQDPASIPLPNTVDPSDMSINDIDPIRSREITAKAVSGILLILLKWFKVSHILKFEYFTQLLLDSNYLPLVLKLFAHQEIEKTIDSKTDREQMSFFAFCNANSKNAPAEPEPEVGSEDEAQPPPISLRREISLAESEDKLPALTFQEGQHAGRRDNPDVDEIVYPMNEAGTEPITEFSWRNFFSSINFLRTMQKICKNKAHRNLLLVQYKSSNILKKSLKVPQPELRLYTLKLFKNQVPYCGRKWRQGNMRVITAIYLHCRPELRDDWLAGSDVDAEVEEALPLEQALRALTHWHNIRRYPDQMGADTNLLEEEHDFFIRELDKMEWAADEGGYEESVADIGWDGNGV